MMIKIAENESKHLYGMKHRTQMKIILHIQCLLYIFRYIYMQLLKFIINNFSLRSSQQKLLFYYEI